jgi:hypothetical protein
MLDEHQGQQQQALMGFQEVPGRNHGHTLTSMTSLSVVFRQQGGYNEAYKLSQQALKVKEEILGKTYPGTRSVTTAIPEAALLGGDRPIDRDAGVAVGAKGFSPVVGSEMG